MKWGGARSGDLRKTLIANLTALDAWNDITPLARNEFICWVENAKQKWTRERGIRQTMRRWNRNSVGPAGRGASIANLPADNGLRAREPHG